MASDIVETENAVSDNLGTRNMPPTTNMMEKDTAFDRNEEKPDVGLSDNSLTSIVSHSSQSQHTSRTLLSSEEESEVEIDEEDSHYHPNSSKASCSTNKEKLEGCLSSSKKLTKKVNSMIETNSSSPSTYAGEKTSKSTLFPLTSRVVSVPSASIVKSDVKDSKPQPQQHPNKLESDQGPATSEYVKQASHKPLASCNSLPPLLPSKTRRKPRRRHRHHNIPRSLPTFRDPRAFMWTSTYDANAPSEDRFSSLVNVILRPPPEPNPSVDSTEADQKSSSNGCCGSVSGDEETQILPGPQEGVDNKSLIRLSLWTVIDGHGGGCVANYASEVVLLHIAASIARELKCTIVDRGVFNVNGQLRDVNGIDLDGLIQSSDRSEGTFRESGIDVFSPSGIFYRSPCDDSRSNVECNVDPAVIPTTGDQNESASSTETDSQICVDSTGMAPNPSHDGTSSAKTSVKTSLSQTARHVPVGTHSPAEVSAITRAITNSFLAIDEGWINSIDPIRTHQTSCISNGKWNAGACALVVFTVQRLNWTRSSLVDSEIGYDDRGGNGGEDTSHNKDAARRRKLDHASRSKSICSLSDLSSTSSLTTIAPAAAASVQESEITETEDDDDVSDIFGPRRSSRRSSICNDPHQHGDVVVDTPGSSKTHYYRPHDAMLYTAHVGDCRAVMLGCAPPTTIKVQPEKESLEDHSEACDDYLSNDSSNGNDIYSSRERYSDSSEEEGENRDIITKFDLSRPGKGVKSGYMDYMHRAVKRQRRSISEDSHSSTFSFSRTCSSDSEENEIESDDSTFTTAPDPDEMHIRFKSRTTKITDTQEANQTVPPTRSNTLAQDPRYPPPLPLSTLMRPIDLTTDHSAYNPAEVTAVLRRCKNAPKAISSASGGGIKRVAGSLAVTRALGDAYLKTPRLSFFPYQRHAPYITARPEVNCRLISKNNDRVLILASDGVWERANGEDILRWVRKYYNERIVGVQGRGKCKGKFSEEDLQSKSEIISETKPETEPAEVNLCRTRASEDKLYNQRHTITRPQLLGNKRKGMRNIAKIDNQQSAKTRRRGKFLSHHEESILAGNSVSDVIIRKVLNKVRRARNLSGLRALMTLPKGRERRSKHDDITASVIDISGFIS